LQEQNENLQEYLPNQIIVELDVMSFPVAIEQVHFPKSLETARKAKERLAFDELFLLQVKSLQKKKEWQTLLVANAFTISQFENQIQAFWEKLPFELTRAQKKAVNDIFLDL